MGLGLEQMRAMTWQEFDYLSIGYQRRVERQLDNTRHMIANMYNSSGFSKKKVDAKDVMRLPLLDKVTKKTFVPIAMEKIRQLSKYIN